MGKNIVVTKQWLDKLNEDSALRKSSIIDWYSKCSSCPESVAVMENMKKVHKIIFKIL